MYIDRMLYPIQALGPGDRLVIWTAGCSRHCPGCANPELWSTENRRQRSISEISKIIHTIGQETPISGITITGGEPFEQPGEILGLLKEIKDITEDVLVYTGYTAQQLSETIKPELLTELKEHIAVLIDGSYKEELNTPDTVLRGSSNQNIIFLREEYRESYEKYLAEGRKIQNVYMGSRLVSVGIHNKQQ